MISERQREILDSLVQEYINSAQPVSSQLLEKKHGFKICPATIRNEMQKLTDKGFLCQPHTSAGRIPTDKGYRFFVDKWFEEKLSEPNKPLGIEDWFPKDFSDDFKLIQLLTKNLALASSSLVLSYLFSDEILWKEGWEKVFQEPEFREKKYTFSFIKFLENFEENIEKVEADPAVKNYIGRENTFSRTREFIKI